MQLGVNPLTGTAVFTAEHILRLPPHLQRLLPEFNAAATPGQRAEARAKRLAEDRAEEEQAAAQAASTLRETGVLPLGWVRVCHPAGGSSSKTYELADGCALAREVDFDTLISHGFQKLETPAANG